MHLRCMDIFLRGCLYCYYYGFTPTTTNAAQSYHQPSCFASKYDAPVMRQSAAAHAAQACHHSVIIASDCDASSLLYRRISLSATSR